MQGAGLTRGALYGYFDSKEQLAADAFANGKRVDVAALCAATPEPRRGLEVLASDYLSTRHCDNRADGCFIAALAGDVSRESGPVRSVFTHALRRFVDTVIDVVPQHGSQAARRANALAVVAQLVGTVILARAVDDPALSNEILNAVQADIADVSAH